MIRQAAALVLLALVHASTANASHTDASPQVANAASAAAAPASPREPLRPWTLMIYGAADNNADGPILEFLDGLRKALDDDEGMELILFIDRSTGFSDDASVLGADFAGARLYRLRKDRAELLDPGEHFPDMASDEEYEADSADPDNVGRFVAFCKQRFPAERYGLMIYSHANGCSMCPDEESGRSMHIPELTEVVDASASVDFLALELCNMGGIEIAYQWRPGNGGFSADVLMAIPTAGPPLDWDRAFWRIRSKGHATRDGVGPVLDPANMDAAAFGNLVIEEGERGRHAFLADHPEYAEHFATESAACLDLRRTADVKRAVDALAVALAAGGEEAKQVLEDLRGPGDLGTVMNFVKDDFRTRTPYVDLFDLARRAAACDGLAPEVRERAQEVCDAMDPFVLSSYGLSGHEGFQPGRNGVFIVFPDGDAELMGFTGRIRVWRELDWYTPLAADDVDQPYGRWAFCADGATPDNGEVENWFELLDHWFDDTSDDPGGHNRYVP